MYCEKCGAKLQDDSIFCEKCGTKVNNGSSTEPLRDSGTRVDALQDNGVRMERSEPLPKGITRDEQGNYRWTYRLNMLKTPVVRNMMIKIMFLCCLGVGVFFALIQLITGEDLDEIVRGFCVIVFGIGGGLSVITFIVYYIVISIHGVIYTVDHIMNEKGIEHIQSPEENERSKKMKKLVFVLNLITMDPAMMGMTMAAKEHLVSEYKDVKKVIAARRYGLIKVNNALQHNHIYAYPEQYEFVWNYIVSNCPDAKIKR